MFLHSQRDWAGDSGSCVEGEMDREKGGMEKRHVWWCRGEGSKDTDVGTGRGNKWSGVPRGMAGEKEDEGEKDGGGEKMEGGRDGGTEGWREEGGKMEKQGGMGRWRDRRECWRGGRGAGGRRAGGPGPVGTHVEAAGGVAVEAQGSAQRHPGRALVVPGPQPGIPAGRPVRQQPRAGQGCPHGCPHRQHRRQRRHHPPHPAGTRGLLPAPAPSGPSGANRSGEAERTDGTAGTRRRDPEPAGRDGARR